MVLATFSLLLCSSLIRLRFFFSLVCPFCNLMLSLFWNQESLHDLMVWVFLGFLLLLSITVRCSWHWCLVFITFSLGMADYMDGGHQDKDSSWLFVHSWRFASAFKKTAEYWLLLLSQKQRMFCVYFKVKVLLFSSVCWRLWLLITKFWMT